MVPVYVSGGSAPENEFKSIVRASVREPLKPSVTLWLPTFVAVGTPQFVLPVTMEVPFTRTEDAAIVDRFAPVPVIGPLM
jgi:hypothetical protein